MRRLKFIIFAVFAAASVVSFSTLSAQAQTADQYGSSDGEDGSQEASERPAPSGFVWQGPVTDKRSEAASEAAKADLAEEEKLSDYSQVVDNSTAGRFQASGWQKKSGGDLSHGGDYVSSTSGAGSATFKVSIPTSNDYAVYVWHPSAVDNSAAARFGISTSSGVKSVQVDQRKDGGMWLKLGTYEMEKGERFVRVSGSSSGGTVVADAVAIVRGDSAAPPDEGTSAQPAAARAVSSKANRRPTGRAVVRQSRRHLGTRYGNGRCRSMVQEDCTCHTKLVFKKFGIRLPDMPGGQWKYGRKVRKSNLRPGDLVFFDDTRNGSIRDAHDGVGIYSGRGMYISANSYFGRVVEKEMKYRPGYHGAKRLTKRR